MVALYRSLFTLLLAISFNPRAVIAGNQCGEITWTKEGNQIRAAPTGSPVEPGLVAAATQQVVPHNPIIVRNTTAVKPGDFVCRFHYATSSDVNYYTCKELSVMFRIDLKFFFSMNPALKLDCSNIQPQTEYCVAGFIEPLRSPDGFCGPNHNNATCSGTAAQCCNAETFRCGNSEEDCAPGTCYEGACPGDKFFTTNGKCGHQNGGRQCAGKWGDCCNKSGICGNGTPFCGPDVCQSGNCNWKKPSTSSISKSSTTNTNPTTSTKTASPTKASTSAKGTTTSSKPAITSNKSTTPTTTTKNDATTTKKPT